jgi:4-diphosphocytidyl-2C-methyl-D-erythritol kinase
MDSIRLKARAKINLGLDVLGKRENGYHDVKMVMQTVGIYDRLIITRIPEDDIRININLKFLPVNENNLIYKAYKLMKDEYGFSGGIDVDLNKFIPIAAGMAGGSTDAASTMFAINKLFNLGLSNAELMEQGVKIGADVPYCIMRDVLEVRSALEELAATLACKNVTPEHIDELKTANRVFEAAIVSKDVVAIVNADVTFHNIIYSMTDNQRLIQLINSLSEQMYRYRLEYVKDARTHSILISEHNDIIRQLADKDVEKAKIIVRQHVNNQEKGIIRLLNI